MNFKEMQSQKGFLQRKLLLQFPAGSPPDTVMNTMGRTRGSRPPARGRKWTIRFIGLCGFNGLAHQTRRRYKALVDTTVRFTLMPSRYKGAEPICIYGMMGGSQLLSVVEAEESLTGKEWQKHPNGTVPEPP